MILNPIFFWRRGFLNGDTESKTGEIPKSHNFKGVVVVVLTLFPKVCISRGAPLKHMVPQAELAGTIMMNPNRAHTICEMVGKPLGRHHVRI